MNQVAVVIGGGQTLGAFLCHGLAAEGYRVAVVDIQSDKAANVAQEINAEYGEGTAYGFGADATSEQSVLALSRGVDEIFGRVDLLVYSAGIAKAAFISDFQLGDFDRSLQVNLVGYFLCAREFSRLMIRDGIQGRIIQINSKSGKVGSKHNSGYSAAKFGGVGLTQSLALDLAEYGITVHSLMLGNLLKSPMFQSLLPQYATKLGIKPEQVEQYYIDKVPLKRGCDYQDVLNMLLFYASPKASYCTGQSINVTRRSGDVLINSGDLLRISARLIECLMRYAYQAYRTSATTSRRSYGIRTHHRRRYRLVCATGLRRLANFSF